MTNDLDMAKDLDQLARREMEQRRRSMLIALALAAVIVLTIAAIVSGYV